MKETMNAVILRAPGDYVYERVEKPECPDDGILLKVINCGLCGSDLRTLKSGHNNVKLPAIIGHEIAGRVEHTGKSYKGIYRTGDDLVVAPVVYCGVCEFCENGTPQYCENIRELAQHFPGGFAEYMAIPADALRFGTIQRMPEGMEYAHAAISEPPSSVLHAQERLNVGIADTVVIIGAGPIGCLHICVARARGAKRIIIADMNEKRLELAAGFNPDEGINTTKQELVETVLKLTRGMGAEVIITANPVGETQVQAIQMAKKAGRIALFGGLPHGNSKPGIDTNIIHYRGLTLIGTTTFAPRHQSHSLDLIKRGLIPAAKFITHRLPLSSFAEGVELAVKGEALKVVYDIN